MLNEQVAIARRFQRSIRLDADLGRADALQGFVCQRSASDGLVAMAGQVAQTTQRAFTWTGPYGGGKSSLAIALAGLLGPKGQVREAAITALGAKASQNLLASLHPSRDGWLVVPVVGRRADPIVDISTALEGARRGGSSGRGRPRADVRSGRELVERLVQEASERPRDGVLLIIDELGKFLEGAAAANGDIYFFQELAEAASRAKGRLVIVGILHQSFEHYAIRLGREARDEWAKIQGRFTDIPLVAGVDEVIDLLGRAIAVKGGSPKNRSAEIIAKSIRSRRPGSPVDLEQRLTKCWPLHPVTATVLGPMSRRRFGQNERSVFGFLTSAEPGGFQDFLRTSSAGSNDMFGAERFWDYLRINLEPAILSSSDSHRWAQSADAIERVEARGSTIHVRLAKTIALIDIFRSGSGLSADRATLGACVLDVSTKIVDAALEDLERWSVSVFRKHLSAWSIYAGSDFDIDGAVTSALAQASGIDLARLSRLAGLHPVLAKRHYHETGSLRWFNSELIHLGDLPLAVRSVADAAGQFLLAIPAGDESRGVALAVCKSASAGIEQLTAIGLPKNAFRIRELGKELVALETVRSSRPELDGDSVARREISARMSAVSADLEEELRGGFADADWYVNGEQIDLPVWSSLSRLASDLADKRYNKAPVVQSELINRQRPSSNTQAGIRDLMRAMVTAYREPYLAIKGFPIHRGLYSTVLAPAGLHRELENGSWGFAEPANTKIGRSYRFAWNAAEKLLESEAGTISLGRVYATWEAPPFGIRRGVMPVLALSFVMANRHRFAVYCEGRFQSEIDDYLVDILLQDENLVAIRQVNVDAFHTFILTSVAAAIATATGQHCRAEALEVARKLVRFVRELPPWTRRTLSLSSSAIEARRVLLQADDPHRALFIDLPAIFGECDAEFTANGIDRALQELSDAYPSMLSDLSRKMLLALGHPTDDSIESLQQRAKVVTDLTGDLRVDAFATRLSSYSGSAAELESIASLAINRPPRDWTDRDPDQAALAIADFALKFRRAEALARVKGRSPSREAMALVIGTGENGRAVVGEYEVAEKDRPQIAALTHAIERVLTNSGADRNIILAALAEAGLVTLAASDSDLRKAG